MIHMTFDTLRLQPHGAKRRRCSHQKRAAVAREARRNGGDVETGAGPFHARGVQNLEDQRTESNHRIFLHAVPTLRRSRLRRRLDHTQGASRGPTASPRAVLGATARCQRGCRPQGRTVCRRADAHASTATIASCCNRVRTEKGPRREDPAKKISSANSTADFEHRDCENRN